MEALLHHIAHYVALVLEGLAILVIAFGAVEALSGMFRVMLARRASHAEQRAVWLKFAHWLVAGLTFQLAADIVQTTIAPSWDDIGRVAAIAAIRTFLTFFLDRDIEAIREREHAPAPAGSDAKRA
jgi:uncharacterized membrane protein